MFPSIGAEGNNGLITADRMEPGENGVLAKAPRGGGDSKNRENSIFLKKGKTVISVKTRNFSRTRMIK